MCCLRIGSPRANRADLLARDEPPPETEMGMSIDSWLLAGASVPRAAQRPPCSPARESGRRHRPSLTLFSLQSSLQRPVPEGKYCHMSNLPAVPPNTAFWLSPIAHGQPAESRNLG